MSFNPAPKVREAIYALSVFVNAGLAVLIAADIKLHIAILAAVGGLNALVALMAKSNVSTTPEA